MPFETYTRCMVLIPAGPETAREYLDDTIESVIHHIGASNCILAVIDDSRQDTFAYVGHAFPNAVVIKADEYVGDAAIGTRGTLFSKQAHALKHLIERYRFDVLLRMDTDALMIGDAPHEDVLTFLKSRPDVGIVGAFRRRGDGSDKVSAMAAKGRHLSREMSLRHGFRNLALVRVLRRLVRRAEAHGYTRGDMCTGGAFFMVPGVIKAIDEQGLFDLDVLRHSKLADDALFALLCCAVGYRLSDLPDDNDLLAINWRGFPMPIEALVSRNKKIVHPVKDADLAVEPRVRAYFRKRREERGSSSRGPLLEQ